MGGILTGYGGLGKRGYDLEKDWQARYRKKKKNDIQSGFFIQEE